MFIYNPIAKIYNDLIKLLVEGYQIENYLTFLPIVLAVF
jgi:hypothetical protein